MRRVLRLWWLPRYSLMLCQLRTTIRSKHRLYWRSIPSRKHYLWRLVAILRTSDWSSVNCVSCAAPTLDISRIQDAAVVESHIRTDDCRTATERSAYSVYEFG